MLTIICLRLRSEANTLKNKYVKKAPEWCLACACILIRSQNCFGEYGKWGTGNRNMKIRAKPNLNLSPISARARDNKTKETRFVRGKR